MAVSPEYSRYGNTQAEMASVNEFVQGMQAKDAQAAAGLAATIAAGFLGAVAVSAYDRIRGRRRAR